MKTISVGEALIALGNGEKITSDYFSDGTTFNGYIHLIKGKIIRNDGYPHENNLYKVFTSSNLRIYQEFTYPMWFKNLHDKRVYKFDSLKTGFHPDGRFTDVFIAHTDKDTWLQTEEPKEMIKVAKYAYHCDNGRLVSSSGFYETDDEACEDIRPDEKTLIRLDYTEIEVEDY